MKESGEEIKAGGQVAKTKALVSASLNGSRTGSEFRADLQKKGIDLVLRYGNGGRLFGATFIDHNSRTVLNGSALSKEFSANKLAERFADFAQGQNRREDLQPSMPNAPKLSADPQQQSVRNSDPAQSKEKGYTSDEGALGSLFSVLTPETHSDDNQPAPKPRKKKKRRYGRQV